MADIDGAWKIGIETPMGVQSFTLDLSSSGNSVGGTATNAAGTWEVKNGAVDGDSLTFLVEPTTPFPLSVTFHLTVEGDALHGESHPGNFPPARVTGERVTAA